MLEAKLLLSSIPHGRIKHIETSKAEALPGVVKIFTHQNTPDTTYNRYRIIPEQEYAPEDEVLFPRKVRFVGDRVAAVVARDRETAEKAASLIDVEFEELPYFLDPEKALSAEENPIHDSGNLLYHYDYETGKKPDPLRNTVTSETTTRTPRIHHAAMETHSCLAEYDGEKLTMYAGCQGSFGVRTIVADFLGLDYNKVRVIKVPLGGSFGARQEAIIEPLTAYLAYDLQYPVKLSLSRAETIVATMVRPATKTYMRTVVSGDGHLREVHAYSLFDAGAHATSSIDYAFALSKKLTRLYRVPHYRHRCDVAFTNTPISGGARGWGAPEIITAIETHMDTVARDLDMDPVELRRKNLIHPYDIDPATRLSLGNARVTDCLTRGAEEFNWSQRYTREPQKGRYRQGVGVACGAHKNGMYGKFCEHSSMVMKMNEDGTFALHTGLHELGCGIVTTIRLIAAETLDIDPQHIAVHEADTETGPYDLGTYGSRVTFIGGVCSRQTAELMKKKILDSAAIILNTPRKRLALENGWVWPYGKKDKKISLKDIAIQSKLYLNTDMLVSHTYKGTSNPGVHGVHFAEVEVDTVTGMVRVTDYLAAQDVGKAINPGMVEGQIQGAVHMGIGYALCEEVTIEENGQIKSNSFKDYHLLNAASMPEVETLLIEDGGDEGPFGAKSIGEIATVPVAAAVVNAVNHALGTSMSELPLTPEKIVAALRSKNPDDGNRENKDEHITDDQRKKISV
jgi:xanthine dehydrogenase molybdenum-binding subunit